jgi:2-polyprenyl-3-methyl-5-hydroxy-6-metoxy-1,4-benzoquinol methylase
MIKYSCRLCGSKKLFKFLDLGYHPPSDQFLNKKQIQDKIYYYPLEVMHCKNCKFKQLSYIVDPKELYQKNYPYESSKTLSGKKHFYKFAKSVVDRFKLTKENLIVDIGSNVGVLLEGFKKNKCQICGVEPAGNICKIANKKNIHTYNSFFNLQTVKKIKSKFKKKAKVITATNVFAHIDNLDNLVINIKHLLEKDGIFIIESPHFYYLYKFLEYDTIYHEHLSYITIEPLIKFFNKFNMQIFDVEKKDIHGGSVRIYVCFKTKYKISKNVKKFLFLENKSKINQKKNLLEFSKRVENNRLDLVKLLIDLKNKNKKIIALSAPAKGMTLLNYSKIDKNFLDFATEKSKIKQGLFLPGSRLPVYSDDRLKRANVDYALLLAWNFAEEIILNNIEFIKKGGQFIIPIPKIKIINKFNYNKYYEKN